MNDTYKIRSVGGSLMIVVPQHIARAMNLKAGDEMTVQAFDATKALAQIVVKPVKQPHRRTR